MPYTSASSSPRNAIVTGASAGLGRALALGLADLGWTLTLDGRRADLLDATAEEVARRTRVRVVAGDVTDPAHRRALVDAAAGFGPVDVVVNNASELGGSPSPALLDLDPATFGRIWQVNVAAPLALVQAVWPQLGAEPVILNVSSDAAVEHYEGWGGYAASKAALDHLTLTGAAEHPHVRWYAVDPGDLRTAMHQAAFPGEDISDRPEPASVVPRLVALLQSGAPSGRYRAGDLEPAPADLVSGAVA